MSDISKLNVAGVEYDIKDQTAREAIEALQTEVEGMKTDLTGATATVDEILETIGGEG